MQTLEAGARRGVRARRAEPLVPTPIAGLEDAELQQIHSKTSSERACVILWGAAEAPRWRTE